MSRKYEDILKEQAKLSAPKLEADKKLIDSMYDTQVQNVKDAFEPEKKAIEQSYENLLDENAVQRRINEHMILRDLTNTGDTNSGLSRTQMTAVQLSHANNQAKIRRQQQAGMEALSLAVEQEISGIEQNRQSDLASLVRSYADSDRSAATSIYNKELEEETARYKADLDAQTKAANAISESTKAKASARTSLLDKITSGDYGDDDKWALVNNYAVNYGLDDNDYNVLKNVGLDVNGKYGYIYFDPKVDRVDQMKKAIDKKVGFNLRTFGESIEERSYYASIVEEAIDEALEKNQITEPEAAELYMYYQII